MEEFQVRTDLAVELRENVEGSRPRSGVHFQEEFLLGDRVKVTKVVIDEEEGALLTGKPMGNYVTVEARELTLQDTGFHREVSEVLAGYIKDLLPKKSKCKILVVGLGNRNATPDALGPAVVDNLFITRNLEKQWLSEDLKDVCEKYEVSGIVPGVMAMTGMESAEIVKGLVKVVKPHVVIAIDSLAARSTARLNTTIQIADTGIHPGSGVGNHRLGLTKESIGVPVIAIGVPTVVDAATIVNDTMEHILEIFSMHEKLKMMANVLKGFSPSEKYVLIREILEPEIGNMYVTPKDIDETIKSLSYTLSEALNIIWGNGISYV